MPGKPISSRLPLCSPAAVETLVQGSNCSRRAIVARHCCYFASFLVTRGFWGVFFPQVLVGPSSCSQVTAAIALWIFS